MHASAQAAWQKFITADEGNVAHMYLCTKGRITVGIGNMIEPISLATALPFQFKARNTAKAPAGRIATRAEIEAEWKSLNESPQRATLKHRGAPAAAAVTNLELTLANRQRLFERITSEHELALVKSFRDFSKWPGDAQLGLMAMAWGLGKNFPPKFPKFTEACRKQDFDAAANESRISTWRAERNAASVTFFGNAARVVKNSGAYVRSQTYYPRILLDTVELRA